MAGQLASMAPLYEKSAGARQLGRIESMGQRQGMTPEQTQQQIAGLGTIGGVDYSKVGSMNRFQYQDFMGKQSGDALRNLRQQGLNMYGFNPFQPSTYKKLF
jgi:hypothetical protein